MMPAESYRLDLFVTEACNLACEYCFASNITRPDPTIEQCRSAIDWLMGRSSERVHITIWGGEPLLRVDLVQKVIEYSRKVASRASKKLTLSMPVNATLLNGDNLRWIWDTGVEIFLSIDGDENAQSSRPIAGGGSSYELATRGLDAALVSSASVYPDVRMTVTQSNAAGLARSVAWLVNRGVRGIRFHAVLDAQWSRSGLEAMKLGTMQTADLLIGWLEASDNAQVVPVLRAWIPVLRKLAGGTPVRPREGAYGDCSAGQTLVALAVDGTFWPCHRMVHRPGGRDVDLCLGRLDDVLGGAVLKEIASPMIEDMRGADGPCVECDIFDLCTCGCIAINHATTGRFERVPAAACADARIRVEACRRVDAALHGNPMYALYLGRSLKSEVDRMSALMGSRARDLYSSITERGA